MKIIFIDDEYDNKLPAFTRTLRNFYGNENVNCFKNATDAFAFLKVSGHDTDLAIIDQNDIDSKLDGIDVGAIISEKYPHIACIMLTTSPSVLLCQRAMRIGFCDFLDKSEVEEIASITNELKRIETLPAVQIKRKLKATTISYQDYETLGVEVRLDCIEKYLRSYKDLNGDMEQDLVTCALQHWETLYKKSLGHDFAFTKITPNCKKYIAKNQNKIIEFSIAKQLDNTDRDTITELWKQKVGTNNPPAIFFGDAINKQKVKYLQWKNDSEAQKKNNEAPTRWRKNRWELTFKYYAPVKNIIKN
jgi:DNA-binding NarL/FixJ family response regulator